MISDLIRLQSHSEKTAIIFHNNNYSYSDLFIRSSNIAKIINKTKGNIAILMPNSYDFIASYFAIALLNKTAVPIYHGATLTEITETLKYTDVSAIITLSKFKTKLEFIIEELRWELKIIELDVEPITVTEYNGELSCGATSCTTEDSAFLLIHTSGSTDNPKRVMLSHKNILSNAQSIIKSLELNSEEITVLVLPLYLISAFTSQLVTHIMLGATILLLEAPFIANDFYCAVQQYSVTNMTCVPTTLNLLTIRADKLNDCKTLKKICFGGAPTASERIKWLIKNHPDILFIQMYGQTEASARLTHMHYRNYSGNVSTVGKPIPNVELIILDGHDQKCSANNVGEICAKGDNVMIGYYKNEAATQIAFWNEYLRTGDFGYMDDMEYLFVVGRKKNVIISGGINIYPEEIEEAILNACTDIKAVRAFGIENDLLGECVALDIIVREGFNLDEQAVYSVCYKVLPTYKQPRNVNFVQYFPTTNNGKMVRRRS